MTAMISLQQIEKRYPGTATPAVDGLSLDIAEGETVALVGPSGCGKTTTLKMINRLIEPTGGRLLIDGTDVLQRDPVDLRRGIGYVIQQIGLMPHRTIRQNMATVPKLLGWDDERTAPRIDELTEIFDLDPELLGPLPCGALGRPATAGRRGARPRRRPSRDADGRAVRRGRPDRARPAAGPVPGHPGAAEQDDRVRDPRHRRGDQAEPTASPSSTWAAMLEQYAPAEEILREPANDFVREFVGAERGLKRLALIKVGDIQVEDGPVVAPDAPPPTRRARRSRPGGSTS